METPTPPTAAQPEIEDVTERDEELEIYDLADQIRSLCRKAQAEAMGTEVASKPFDTLTPSEAAPYLAVAKWHHAQTAYRNSEANVQRLVRAARPIVEGFTAAELEDTAPEFKAEIEELAEALSQIRITE